MKGAIMVYEWVVFIHISSVLGFMLVHGISMGIALRLRSERNVEHIRGLLTLSRSSIRFVHLFVLLVFVTGLTLGFLGNWWSHLWIWTALAVGVVMYATMFLLGTRYYDRVRRAVGVKPFYGAKKDVSVTPTRTEGLETLLSSSRPILLAAIGIGGLVIILWLMLFKPF